MAYLENEFYHIYNQGNNKVTLFHSHDHYICFLAKVREFIKPNCDIMVYCLMPNHDHFLILTNEKSVQMKKVGNTGLSALSNGVKVLTSSYAQALNKQLGNTGQKPNINELITGKKGTCKQYPVTSTKIRLFPD